MIGVVFGALAKADPDRATAAPFGTINALSHRRAQGQWRTLGDVFPSSAAGLAAILSRMASTTPTTPISTATIPPAEVLEASYPVMFTQWALRPDSAARASTAAASARSTRLKS